MPDEDKALLTRDRARGDPDDYTLLPVERLRSNEWNPNQMVEDEFAELVAEVRHLGRLPKPVIVRANGDGWDIVDGEHGWRAAKEVGLAEVNCEVVAVDDFEAMRQTYKRNQHGTHNPVLLGQIFQRMLKERDLSRPQSLPPRGRRLPQFHARSGLCPARGGQGCS